MIPLTCEENKSYKRQKGCYICKNEFNTDKNDKNAVKLYHKVRGHCHYTGRISKEIPIVFHNGSTYDYHFVIKKLAKEFDVQFECFGGNTEKYITFSAPIKKDLKMVKQLHTN